MPFINFDALPSMFTGSRASKARFFDQNGINAIAANDVIRLKNYNPANLNPVGMFLEGIARTNMISGRKFASNGSNLIRTQNAAIGPTGQMDAQSIVPINTQALNNWLGGSGFNFGSSPFCIAVPVKRLGSGNAGRYFRLAWRSNGYSISYGVNVDLETMTVQARTAGDATIGRARIVPWSNGWYRIIAENIVVGGGFTDTTLESGFTSGISSLINTTVQADGVSGVLIGDIDVQLGRVMSSSVPGGAATRERDVVRIAQISDIGLTPTTLQNGYTIVATVRASAIDALATHRILELNNSGSTDNVVHMSLVNGQFAAGVTTAGVSQFAVAGGAAVEDTIYKIGLSVGPSGSILCVNGTQIGSTGSAMVMPTPSRAEFANGEGSDLGGYFNYADMDVYVRPLTLAQLQSATQ